MKIFKNNENNDFSITFEKTKIVGNQFDATNLPKALSVQFKYFIRLK